MIFPNQTLFEKDTCLFAVISSDGKPNGLILRRDVYACLCMVQERQTKWKRLKETTKTIPVHKMDTSYNIKNVYFLMKYDDIIYILFGEKGDSYEHYKSHWQAL